jgi:hypothetical protein
MYSIYHMYASVQAIIVRYRFVRHDRNSVILNILVLQSRPHVLTSHSKTNIYIYIYI